MALIAKLSDIEIEDLVQLIVLRRQSGRLSVSTGGVAASLHFADGRLVLVRASDPALRLGQACLRRGVLDEQRLDGALRAQEDDRQGWPLGRLLLARGWATIEDLTHGLEEQGVAVLAKVMAADAGTLVFRQNVPVPPRTALIPLRVDRIILEAIRRLDERSAGLHHAPPAGDHLSAAGRVGELVVARITAPERTQPSMLIA